MDSDGAESIRCASRVVLGACVSCPLFSPTSPQLEPRRVRFAAALRIERWLPDGSWPWLLWARGKRTVLSYPLYRANRIRTGDLSVRGCVTSVQPREATRPGEQDMTHEQTRGATRRGVFFN